MSEEPASNQEQQPATPQQPPESATGEGQTPVSRAADKADAPTGAAPGTTPQDAAGSGPDASAGKPAEQAGQPEPEHAEPAKQTSAGSAATEPPTTGQVSVSAEEVQATVQEMIEAAESSTEDAEQGRAAGELAAAAPTDEVEAVIAATQEVVESAGPRSADGPAQHANAVRFDPPDFSAQAGGAEPSQIDLLDDVELEVKIELGRTEMYIEDVLGLGAGSVIELDKAAGDPVDIFVNGRLVARGEVLVLNDNFCVRINDILSPVPELEENP